MLGRALCQSPQLAQALAAVAEQQAAVQLQRAGGQPQLHAQAGWAAGSLRQHDSGDTLRASRSTRELALSLQWELFDFGQRQAQVQAAQDLLRAALDSQDQAVQQLLMDTAEAYYDQVLAAGRAQLLSQSEAATSGLLQQAQLRKGDQALDKLGLLQARASLARTSLSRQQADTSLRMAQARLAALLGLPVMQALQLQAPVPPRAGPALDPQAESLVTEALQQHPQLRAARARAQAQQGELQAARRSRWPVLSLVHGQRLGRDAYGVRERQARLGLELQVPLLDGGAQQARQAQAAAELRARLGEVQVLEQELARKAYEAWLDLQGQAGAHRLALQLRDVAQALLAGETSAFLAGDSDMFDVLDARETLDEADDEVLSASVGMALAQLRLAAALGRLR